MVADSQPAAGLGREDTLLRLAGQSEAASPWPGHAQAANVQAGGR